MENKKIYSDYCIKKLNDFSNFLKSLTKECENFKNELINGSYLKEIIKYIGFSNNYHEELQKGIDNYINIINSINDISEEIYFKRKQEYYEDIKVNFKYFCENISKLYNNHLIENIINYNKNLEEIFNDIDPNFEPPNINSFASSKVHINLNTQSFISNEFENNLIQYNPSFNEEDNELCDQYNKTLNKVYDSKITENEENNSYKCTICKDNECKLICHDCNFLFCKKCYNQNYNIEVEKNNHNIQMVDKLSEIEKEKLFFMNSLSKIKKELLIKSNYLLNSDNFCLDVSCNNFNDNDNGSLLKLKCINKIIFKYPFIREINKFESQIDYLKEMHNIIIKNFKNNNLYKNLFHISTMNIELLNAIENIFNDNKIKNLKEIFDKIDDEFYLEEDFK